MDEKELIYDHYKDSFEQQKQYLKKRERLTMMILLCMILLLAFVHDPSVVSSKINTAIGASIQGLQFDMKYLNTFVLYFTLWTVVQYYQVIFVIEKMYCYLRLTEDKFTETCSTAKITREGSFYLEYNSWFSNLVDVCYVYLLPSTIAIIAVVKLINEWDWKTNFKYIDIAALFILFIASLLYIVARKTMKKPTHL